MKIRRDRKGFTLIELLIVVAIIGILAAIAIPAYSGYTAKSKVAGVVHAMGAVKSAVAAYYTEAGTGTVPTATGAAAIATAFGVEVPEQYATMDVTNDTGLITATLKNNVKGADLLGATITLTPDWTTKQWSWGGTIAAAYLPKS